MKIILDTNVLISGIFFGGKPYQILDAWRKKRLEIVLSEEIFNEYQRVSLELSKHFKEVDISSLLNLIAINAIWVEVPPLPFSISTDPDDNKFISCAFASGTKIIISGDKHLLEVSGVKGIKILKPSEFVKKYLK